MFNKLVSARNSKKGFTLIELMVVVAIIAILAAVAIPGYLSYKTNAETGVVKNALNSMIDMINASEATGQLQMEINSSTTIQNVIDNYDASYDHISTSAVILNYIEKDVDGTYYTLKEGDSSSPTDFHALYVA